jgi:hypothetical protein
MSIEKQDGGLYDETYTGDRWTYALTHRPLAMYHVPNNWILFSNRYSADYSFGTVDYARELSAEDVYRYELVLVREPKPNQNQIDRAILVEQHIEDALHEIREATRQATISDEARVEFRAIYDDLVALTARTAALQRKKGV